MAEFRVEVFLKQTNKQTKTNMNGSTIRKNWVLQKKNEGEDKLKKKKNHKTFYFQAELTAS